ncbi:hypothetical protein HMPREF0494_1870 [Limosilactobacillus antri DSM 16041]|uniref:Uncharacterized protein n=1 Tax=Limosilactobacillus antri DSM 16041 TaxID=525309 RepID=C8P976_9LACO|nr:hypothetical protein HMPREF0494_1870 [Limosilactobacillus antri DSM 16041]
MAKSSGIKLTCLVLIVILITVLKRGWLQLFVKSAKKAGISS